VEALFSRLGTAVNVVIHTAAPTFARLGGARSVHRLPSECPCTTLNLLESTLPSLPRRSFYCYEHKEGLRRHTQLSPADRIKLLRNRILASILCGHRLRFDLQAILQEIDAAVQACGKGGHRVFDGNAAFSVLSA
jgi:hypothetical protein